jgi:hypothetical protein
VHNAKLKFVALGLVLYAACKDKKPTDPGGTPTTIEVVSAAPANGVVNTVISPVPTFQVKNGNGEVMQATVSVVVISGGGSISGAPTSSVLGETGVGNWTLGKTVGSNVLGVVVGALDTLKFTVTSTPGTAKKIIEVNAPGAVRSAAANTTVAGPIVVAVADSFNNKIATAGQNITFAVQAGGGSLTGTTTVATDGSGNATAPAWKLGKSANTQTLRAVSGSLVPGDVSATVATNYNIVVRFFGATPMSSTQQAIFQTAAARIMGIITGDVANVNLPSPDLSSCAPGATSPNEVGDDIIIYAEGKNIDGAGNVLGSARPCYTRQPGAGCGVGCQNIPIIGVMSFDLADLNQMESNGTLQDVITHEMLHVVGVGSLWGSDYFDLRTGTGGGDPRYTGAQGVAGCQATGGSVTCASSVPVENQGGSGTRDAHWRDVTFANEIMTGFLSAGTNPISALTVRAIQDMGYSINTLDDDAYTIPGGLIMAPGSQTASQSAAQALLSAANWEAPMKGPLYGITLKGAIKLIKVF